VSGGEPAIALRDAACAVALGLVRAGHQAYFAGGCVRDRLLARPVKDYDIATSARPDEVKAVYPKARGVGEAFGVMLVRHGGHTFEVATFREDGPYQDGRRPSEVTYSTAERDAARRDFTINGLFEDPATGETIDFVEGASDIAARLVRAIGDPHERIREDRLRMLRAARFAARLGFEIESRTPRRRSGRGAWSRRRGLRAPRRSERTPPRGAAGRSTGRRLVDRARGMVVGSLRRGLRGGRAPERRLRTAAPPRPLERRDRRARPCERKERSVADRVLDPHHLRNVAELLAEHLDHVPVLLELGVAELRLIVVGEIEVLVDIGAEEVEHDDVGLHLLDVLDIELHQLLGDVGAHLALQGDDIHARRRKRRRKRRAVLIGGRDATDGCGEADGKASSDRVHRVHVGSHVVLGGKSQEAPSNGITLQRERVVDITPPPATVAPLFRELRRNPLPSTAERPLPRGFRRTYARFSASRTSASASAVEPIRPSSWASIARSIHSLKRGPGL